MDPDNSPDNTVPLGLAILGLLVTGVLGWVHAFIFASGLGLMAAAVAFGILLYMSLT